MYSDELSIDLSDEFESLCEACRSGGVSAALRLAAKVATVNARNERDYTPLCLASLCGHVELVAFLAIAGAHCNPSTWHGQRCLQLALNDDVKTQLSAPEKISVPSMLQERSAHFQNLLRNEASGAGDFLLMAGTCGLRDHKVVVVARCPFFHELFEANATIDSWRAPRFVSSHALRFCVYQMYGDHDAMERMREACIATGNERDLDRLASSWGLLDITSTLAIQGFRQWYREAVLGNAIRVNARDDHQWLPATTTECVQSLADVVLRPTMGSPAPLVDNTTEGISTTGHVVSVFYAAHKAILRSSKVFTVMFRSVWLEAKRSAWIRVVSVDCSPQALEVVLEALYTGMFVCPEPVAAEVMCTADMLLLEPLKVKAGLICASMVEMQSTNELEDLHRSSRQARLPWLEKRVGPTLARRYNAFLPGIL